MKTTQLQCIYDSRKSFGGKATVTTTLQGSYLTSYGTKVAEIKDNKLLVYGYFSPTTGRHINEYTKQNGFSEMSKQEIEQLII